MKIGIFSDSFYPEIKGGGEMMAWRLAKQYLIMGYEVVVFTATQDKKNEVWGQLEGGFKIYRFFSDYHRGLTAYFAFFNYQVVFKIAEVLKKEKLDIVHIHNIHHYLSYYSLVLLKRRKIPSVLTVHESQPICYKKFDCFIDFTDRGQNNALDYKIKQWRCFLCQKKRYFFLRPFLIRYFFRNYIGKVFAVSQELAKALRANKVRCDGVIYNGLEPNDFSETDLLSRKSFKNKYSLASKKVIFYGGRLSFAKGTDQLLVVWPLIRNKVSEVVLLVAGDEAGYVKKALFQRQKDIIFTGWLNEQEMRVVYSLSDLVVFPSLYLEPFGLIVIEAMASKKPVVGTCFGGVKEIVIDGQTGFIANPINKEEFAEKISSILSDEELAKKMGERGLEIVRERFDIKKTAQHYLLELKNLIKSRN